MGKHAWRLLPAAGAALALAGCVPETPPATSVATAGQPREVTFPVGTRADWSQSRFLIGSHSAMDTLYPTRTIAPPRTPLPLRPASGPPLEVRFNTGLQGWTLDSFVERTPTTGLLVLRRDGTILAERYPRARRPDDRLASWSMAKTVVAMMVGQAVQDGRIRSLDDAVATYVPALAESAYGPLPIRHLLSMSSGVAFDETYTRNSDITRLSGSTFGQTPGGAAAVAWLTRMAAAPGVRFNYSSADSHVLGLVLTAATGKPLADLLAERIWQPMGAEFPASWQIDNAGHETAWCCINAALRDYGRLGLLLANGGRALDGRQVVPEAWVRAMVTPSAGTGAPDGGYGYQTWIGSGGDLALFRGVRGQWLAVHLPSGTVVVRTAARPHEAAGPDNEATLAMIRAVVTQVTRGS
ncbi:serine hydrolase domain-containing protein [Falsiroseomonas oryzae]|uniref:serine hydrolase domain-containing protein n=1 Tax=Falsiroseomonas oryzae TaxID=2766473 RepID=UPI0022EA7D8F|nr:serine hydrolase [Roseomonas sp. MO-31]